MINKVIVVFLVTLIISCNSQSKISQKSKKDSVMTKIVKSETDWKKQLTEQQFYVTRQSGTERPFTGKYWNFYESGSYACICCNTILFDSETKFKSGCGWPSFYDIRSNENIKFIQDYTHGMIRTEVRCAICDAHLGHVFEDGPKPTGLRYCINSESLIFILEKK